MNNWQQTIVLIFIVIEKYKKCHEPINYSNLEVNPYKCKLTQGIAIEFYYGFPYTLWTKFGSIKIHGSNHELINKVRQMINFT